jgi:GMP reductase
MRIITDVKLDFDDVLIQPKRSTIASRREVNLLREFKFKNSDFCWVGMPLVSSNMTTVTTPTVAMIMSDYDRKMLACLPKGTEPSNSSTIRTVGLRDDDYKSLNLISWEKFLCVDVANGYMEKLVDVIEYLHKAFPHVTLIAGNVVTPEMTEALILAGADIVKVGIGSGSACTTRIITGVGYPQLSAIIECGDAAHGLGGHIISDGGCVTPGDVAKAFGAGADFVMLGGMLAGHDENGTKFYGMSSETANEIHAGGLRDYRAAEGKELELEPRGPIEKTLQEIEGGLRSACSYVGARKLKDLPKCTTFVRVNRILNTSLD